MDKSDRNAYRRALRWKKEPLCSHTTRIQRAGQRDWRLVWSVKPLSPELRPWVSEEDINAAARRAAKLNGTP